MKHIVKFKAGHDCIKFKCKFNSEKCIPDKGGSHGRGGLSVMFYSEGKDGVVQFMIYTGWFPQHATTSEIGCRYIENWGTDMIPADLGYHSKKPMYEGQTQITDSCELLGNQPCYYNGSGLNAVDAMYTLVNGGDEALWKFLDAYYDNIFNGLEYPEVVEYSQLPREA